MLEILNALGMLTLLAMRAFSQAERTIIPQQVLSTSGSETILSAAPLLAASLGLYRGSKQAVEANLLTRLHHHFRCDSPFLNPGLTLRHVAKQLQTNTTTLSFVVNAYTGLNFNDFVNGFRIEAVKKRLLAGEYGYKTLFSIARECGFNSKSTFNRAFKKATGVTPAGYIAAFVDGPKAVQGSRSECEGKQSMVARQPDANRF